eukprot:869389-Prymnesium_polylepis.1
MNLPSLNSQHNATTPFPRARNQRPHVCPCDCSEAAHSSSLTDSLARSSVRLAVRHSLSTQSALARLLHGSTLAR